LKERRHYWMKVSMYRRTGRSYAWLFCVPFCVLAVVTPALFAQQGSVTGRIDFSPAEGSPSVDSSGAVVWLTRLGDSGETHGQVSPQRLQLVQRHKGFSPRVLVVPVGSVVEFPNQDPFFHNVFSLFEGKQFDLGLYEAGSSRTLTFDRPGISYIFCNIHAEMHAVVIAVKTQYYGVSDRNGGIVIPHVPDGRYEMRVWHELVLPEVLNNLTRTIVISETSRSFGVVHLAEQRKLFQAHKNKYGQEYNNPTPPVPGYPHP
jgi:plastocyanin